MHKNKRISGKGTAHSGRSRMRPRFLGALVLALSGWVFLPFLLAQAQGPI